MGFCLLVYKIWFLLCRNLTDSDCVTFYSMLNKLRSSEYVMSSSGWLLLDEAELLFAAAKKRLYNDKKGKIILFLVYYLNIYNIY